VADEAELVLIVTAAGQRRRGVARKLLARFIRATRAKGAQTVHLEVRETNKPAIALYEGAGFEETGIRPGYYPDGANARVFRRSTHVIADSP
jgi:ribosomal-protein-alanine N-acetyltransferase